MGSVSSMRCKGGLVAVVAALLFVFSVTLLAAVPAQLAYADAGSGAAAANGWNSAKTKYYENGTAVTGAKQISGKWYAFNGSGKLMKKSFKLSGTTYYSNSKGLLEARKAGSTFYYNNGKKMTKADANEYKTIEKARGIAKKITKKSWSKSKKLRTCFNWVRAKYYALHREWKGVSSWPATYAMDHYNNKGGDCHSDAAAFAYLAYAVGYTKVYCCTDSGTNKENNHAWAEINGKVYDPLFDQSKSGSYFGRSYANFMTSRPTTKVKIPSYSSKNTSASVKKLTKTKASSKKNGLVKSGKSYYFYKNGKKVKSTWKTVKGKRYYFKGNGKAATGSSKVKGTYYVFNAKGQLLKGKKTREVTVGKNVYRVTKSGKAAKGWNSAKTKRYDKTGLLLTGVRVVSGKLYAASSSGVYNADETNALRAAAVKNASASTLLQLLGTPKKKTYMGSCNTVNGLGGKDGILEYSHIIVTTFLDSEGNEWLMSIEAA